MKKSVFTIFLAALCLSGCATTNPHPLKVETLPADALVSVHKTKYAINESIRTVAGTTPVAKDFDFPKESNSLWLEIEKRGFAPMQLEVTPETRALSVKLERINNNKGEPVREFAFPPIKRLLVVAPEFEVIKRGFASEEVSKEESSAASECLVKGTLSYFNGKYEIVPIRTCQEDVLLLKSLWRDARTAMELVDPIRLKYLSNPQFLETKNGREAAHQLGSRYEGEALLVISGKQNLETAGLVIGKIGISALGTAASFGGAYANAVSSGNNWFVYTVYLPSFAQGTLIKATLIDCATGELLWVNKGIWGAVKFEDPDEMGKLAKDLFSNLR